MVDEYRTDDEQIEAIKNWWNENGRSTLITVVLAVGGVFGWQQWQSSQQQSSEAASTLYQQILEALPESGEQTAAQKATALHLATELKADHDGSTYAHFAALHMAKLSVHDKDLDAARDELNWVLDNDAPDPALTSLARLRLARVVFSEEGPEAGLAMIDNVETGAYRSDYAELRGDMYEDLGQLEQAEQHYGLAREALGGVSDRSNPLLELKYKSVVRRLPAVAAADVAEPVSSESVEAGPAEMSPEGSSGSETIDSADVAPATVEG